MDRVQKWCQIRHNYALANESNWQITYILKEVYTFTSSPRHLFLGPKNTRGMKCHLEFLMPQNVVAKWPDTYFFPTWASTWGQNLAERSEAASRGYFCCYAGDAVFRCDLQRVIYFCNPSGTISTVLHIFRFLALGNILIQLSPEEQHEIAFVCLFVSSLSHSQTMPVNQGKRCFFSLISIRKCIVFFFLTNIFTEVSEILNKFY